MWNSHINVYSHRTLGVCVDCGAEPEEPTVVEGLAAGLEVEELPV